MHRCLEILRFSEPDVNEDVVLEATHEKVVCLLNQKELRHVADHGVKMLLIVLDALAEREACQLSEPITADGCPKAQRQRSLNRSQHGMPSSCFKA